ncbi:MAG: DUF2254 domain-containing protein [Polyangiaceae bacterium]|nr:DUF2254 domain-containing protein [Myxococcales bacterium]MCB9586157.1 DUF2254 domain-containing protein [Polyangiaceae bacterium]MCB9606834.1 DUF2254 domain-containing protein [Polyangiaceae bacterium]
MLRKRVVTKLRHWWQEMQASFWFVPTLMVVGAVALAAALIALDTTNEPQVASEWPLIFGSGADGSRALLATVAGSMVTVTGVVFSVTIVALSLTSSQYTSRVLRNFMRDRRNQVVLGVFVGIFAYCLVVLRTIHGDKDEAFVPSLAVLGALVLAFVGIAHLIFFIHHISMSIQASSIIAAAAEETISAIETLFPEKLGDGDDEELAASPDATNESGWKQLSAEKNGYLQSVDTDALLEWAHETGSIIRLERTMGDFVVEGTCLASVLQSGKQDSNATDKLNVTCVLSRLRTVEQDPTFGIRQIVDIALKALSPGVNDTTTAVICVDYLSAIFVSLSDRIFRPPHGMDDGVPRVIARGPTFAELLAEGFDEIRQSAAGNVAVLTRQLGALETLANATSNAGRRQALSKHVELVLATAEDSIALPADRVGIQAMAQRLSQALRAA